MLNHSLIDDVNSWLTFILEVFYNQLYLRPCDLLLELVSIFKVEDDLLKGYGSSYLWILNSWLVDKLSIRIIILDFEEERLHGDGLVSKGIQSTEDVIQFFPTLLGEDALFGYFDGLVVEEASDGGAIDEENIQELKQCEPVAIFMG